MKRYIIHTWVPACLGMSGPTLEVKAPNADVARMVGERWLETDYLGPSGYLISHVSQP